MRSFATLLGQVHKSHLFLILAGVALSGTLSVPSAQAQFVCGGSLTGAEPQTGGGATATGSALNFACGTSANATGLGASANSAAGASANASGGTVANPSRNTAFGAGAFANGVGGRNTAIGQSSDATGGSSGNTAIGQDSDAHGNISFNTATGTVARAQGVSSRNTATGAVSNAIGDDSFNTATGHNSNASGNNSSNTAVGDGAIASGSFSANTAVGASSSASGTSTAVGAGATANFANSAAFGAGATVIQNNQMVFGTTSNTYTAPGITSAASRAAQSGSLQVVTSDAGGNLATDAGFIFDELGDLRDETEELEAGVAIALALEDPDLARDESFGIKVNGGFFEGSTALGITAAGVLARDFAGAQNRLTVSGGVGFGGDDTIGGRVGMQLTW